MNRRKLIESGFKLHGRLLRLVPYGYAPLPPLIIWELTFRCNLRCEMCAFYGKHGIPPDTSHELTTEEAMQIVDNLASSYHGYPYRPLLGFTGGEPFMRKDLLAILAYARKKGFRVSVTTNFAIPTEEMLGELARLKPADLRISLDGPQEVHDGIRGVRVFDRVMENIRFVKANSTVPVRLNCTVLQDNLGHLDQVLDLAHRLKAHLNFQYPIFIDEEHIRAQALATRDRLGECLGYRADLDVLSQEEVAQLSATMARLIRKAQGLKRPLTFTPDIAPNRLPLYYHDLTWLPSGVCTFVWSAARISPEGRVYPCFEFYYGNLKEETFGKIWNGSRARKFRTTIKESLLPACVRCCKL